MKFSLNKKISILMPAYNEGNSIYNNLIIVQQVFNDLGNPCEIIVIDDGSTDNTLSEISKAVLQNKNIIIRKNHRNMGKGMALKQAFSLAAGGLVLFLDSDLDLHPRQFIKLLDIFEKEQADVVIGSKRHPDSTLHYPLSRKVISSVYFFIIRFLFGLPINDTQTGIKLFKYEVLEKVFPRILVKRFAFDLEILINAHHLGYKIAQAPVVVDFKKKLGLIPFRSIYETFIDTLAIYYRLKILKYYDRPIPRLTSRPLVSIIIPVQDYSSYLRQCVNSCLQLDYDNFEIIILPDKKIEYFDTLVQIIPTGRLNPAAKRDIGLKYARGEIIAFIDDDAYPDKKWLNAALPYFSDEKVAAVGGPAVTPDEDNIRQKYSGRIYSSFLVSGSYNYRYIPKLSRQVEDYPSVNLLVRKLDLIAVSGFQTEYWPGEDTILCLKIIKDLKKKIVYEPDALVYHHRREIFKPHLKQIREYALHRGYFVKHYPETSLKTAYFIPSMFLFYILIGWVPGFFINPFFFTLYFSLLSVYLGLVFLESLKIFNLIMIGPVFCGIILTHLTYGYYFIKGLVIPRLKK